MKWIILTFLMLSGCVIVQSIPERRIDPAIPVARVIIEQRQAQPVRPPGS